MKRILALLCSVLAATPLLAQKEQAASGGPCITFEETRHDFGSIDPQPLKWSFKFKNTGDTTLEIKEVKPGCGCTVIPDYDKKVEPGREGKITAELNASAMKGHIEKGINVSSNDPKNPNVHLAIVAEIKIDLQVFPQPAIWLTRLQTDSVTNQTLEIRSALPEPLVVEQVESSVPWLTAEVTQSTSNSAKIVVTTKPPIPTGMQKATITAHTKYEKYKDVPIAVTAQIPPILSAVPSRLVFLKNAEQKSAEISVLVMRNDGKEFQIKEVQADSPQISSELSVKQPGHSYSVLVKYVPKAGQGPMGGKISILTDDPRNPKLELPYFYR